MHALNSSANGAVAYTQVGHELGEFYHTLWGTGNDCGSLFISCLWVPCVSGVASPTFEEESELIHGQIGKRTLASDMAIFPFLGECRHCFLDLTETTVRSTVVPVFHQTVTPVRAFFSLSSSSPLPPSSSPLLSEGHCSSGGAGT